MRSITDVLTQTHATLDKGLTAAAASDSRERFGRNALTALPRESIWKKFIEKFDDPIIRILLAAALLSMIVDLFKVSTTVAGAMFGALAVLFIGLAVAKKGVWIPSILFVSALALFGTGLGLGHVLVEGMAVMIAVILATGVAFLSEYRSDREFEVLNQQKDSIDVKALRDGHIHSIPIEDVVVGDIVVLEMGDEIPADGRIFRASELLVDQSLMTGESEAVRKLARPADDAADGPEQPGCVYRGTQIVDGAGQMVVTDVGDATYLGQIARRLSSAHDDAADAGRVKKKLSIAKDSTPLQEKLATLASTISRIGYVAAGLIFLAQLGRGVMRGNVYWPHSGADAILVAGELLDYFVTMVIVIVVAVPEGLPMSVTVSLALAMRKMTRANSLVRQLVACETIGSATVICSDKTGTLTQNKMQVDRVAWGGAVFSRGTAEWPTLVAAAVRQLSPAAKDALALNAAVNSTANLAEKDGKIATIGNSTEGALLQWLREHGVDYEELRHQHSLAYQLHFSSDRKRMTSVIAAGDRLLCLVKGAPEWVLEHCRHYQTADGATRPLDPEMRTTVERQIETAARQAMRTLAFAQATLPEGTPAEEDALHALGEKLEADLVFVGFVAIRDPLRHDVKAAVDECRAAGIGVMMVTGDNVETARAIAHEIGLISRLDEPIDDPNAAVLTSHRFNELTDDELKAIMPGLRVVARARPLDKYRLVKLFQEMGEVVAVTGDGTNDAPALKKADVGLAMGISGTEVAKEASKIVLLDDAFSTIVKAVHWGRSLYENIQRFLQFQLTINISALAITFLGVLIFDVRAPFTVLQLLWINVIMDTFASIALCSEPPRPGLMKHPPKRRDESIVTPAMLRTILLTGAFFLVVMLGLLRQMKGTPDAPGLFAGTGRWDVEVGASRVALPREHLVSGDDGQYYVSENADDPLLRGHKAAVAFTVLQVTLFFTIYVFFQVWNQVNCRSLTPRASGLQGLFQNPTFLAIAGLTALGQVAIVTFGGPVFKVQPLDWQTWLAIVAVTSSVIVFAEIVRFLQRRPPLSPGTPGERGRG
jgi:Ca2+-transporting ATPase